LLAGGGEKVVKVRDVHCFEPDLKRGNLPAGAQ